MAMTFDKLRADAKIFDELKKNPSWWLHFKNDPSLYIEIRKDNQVNVYYEGGSIARIHYCGKQKKLQVFIHHKYLGVTVTSKSNPYIECSDIIDESDKKNSDIIEYDEIIRRVKECYSRKNAVNGVNDKENWTEKFIQGSLIVRSQAIHLDSEFAYNDSISKNRIDLIKCNEGRITFIELKRMSDGRMLHKTEETPEVIKQMERYRCFIRRYSDELLHYYQTLYAIKKSLQLPVPKSCPASINPEPKLLVFDTWVKNTSGRNIHRKRLQEILESEHIDYSIETDF